MKSLISKILGVPKTLWTFLWPLITKQAGSTLVVLLPVAYQIVKDLASNNNISSSEKRQQAFDQLLDVAKNQGITAATSLINLIIEIAVTNFKTISEK